MKIRVIILLTKTTAAQNKVALSYDRVRGPYFLAVVFVSTICITVRSKFFTMLSIMLCDQRNGFKANDG